MGGLGEGEGREGVRGGRGRGSDVAKREEGCIACVQHSG